jgi:hypothetical protein
MARISADRTTLAPRSLPYHTIRDFREIRGLLHSA